MSRIGLADGRVAQRRVLYLGEINASQREAWRKTIEVREAIAKFKSMHMVDVHIPTTDGRELTACRLARFSRNLSRTALHDHGHAPIA